LAKSHFRGTRGRHTWVDSKGNIAIEADDNLATCFNGHIESNGLHPELGTDCAIKTFRLFLKQACQLIASDISGNPATID
jgi:hypothetical protein